MNIGFANVKHFLPDLSIDRVSVQVDGSNKKKGTRRCRMKKVSSDGSVGGKVTEIFSRKLM